MNGTAVAQGRFAPQPAQAASAMRVTTGTPARILILLMILSAAYDKSGVAITIGGRAISVAYYKVFFLAAGAVYILGLFSRTTRPPLAMNRGLIRWIAGFVVIQSVASIIGNFVTAGTISFPSEFYYFIQRSSFLLIPLLGLRYNLPPRTILKMFIGTVLIHYSFIAVQFISPALYSAFVEAVADPLRTDNSIGWARESLDFIGLQTTGNYGCFAAAFGLLVVAFHPKSVVGKMAKGLVVFSAIFIAFFGHSRAVLMFVTVSLLVFIKTSRLFVRAPFYFWGLMSLCLIAAMLFSDLIPQERFTSIYAFVNPEREDSTLSKINILNNSWEMVARSPVVGWGQQRFLDIQYALDLDLGTTATHSFVLSTLLGSGIIGLLAYGAIFFRVTAALWERKESDCAIVCAMFVGLALYNIIYDAGSLDIFACFNGVVAYYAVTAVRNPELRGTRCRQPSFPTQSSS